MLLYITRMMWSALLINENEASGAWIDIIHMLIGKMIGTKQAKYKSMSLLQSSFSAYLLVLSFGFLASRLQYLRCPYAYAHVLFWRGWGTGGCLGLRLQPHCLKILVVKDQAPPSLPESITPGSKQENEKVHFLLLVERKSQPRPVSPSVSSGGECGGSGMAGHRPSRCHFTSEAEVKCKANKCRGGGIFLNPTQ